MLPGLTPLDLTLLALAATLVGLSKTALPGAGTLSVAVFAAVLPARESTGALLVLLIVGDLFAVRMYHAHADLPTLRRMVPAVLVGVGAGAAFLALAGDTTVRRVIGVVLLALVGVTLARRAVAARRPAAPPAEPATEESARPAAALPAALPPTLPPGVGRAPRVVTGVYGALAGFTTMVANAGGPVMALYLLAARFPVQQFLGTAAWFFLAVNLAKTPFSIALGLISVRSLVLDLVLAPAVVAGALIGRRVARHLDQTKFERLVLVLTVVSAVYLLR